MLFLDFIFRFSNFKNYFSYNFPGDPMVNTPYFPFRGQGLIPGQGTKILHATQARKKSFPLLSTNMGLYYHTAW